MIVHARSTLIFYHGAQRAVPGPVSYTPLLVDTRMADAAEVSLMLNNYYVTTLLVILQLHH